MNGTKRTTTLEQQEQILEIMRREAGKGRFFAPTSFAEFFEGVELGSSSTIQHHLKALIVEGRITLAQVSGIKKPFMLPMRLPQVSQSLMTGARP